MGEFIKKIFSGAGTGIGVILFIVLQIVFWLGGAAITVLGGIWALNFLGILNSNTPPKNERYEIVSYTNSIPLERVIDSMTTDVNLLFRSGWVVLIIEANGDMTFLDTTTARRVNKDIIEFRFCVALLDSIKIRSILDKGKESEFMATRPEWEDLGYSISTMRVDTKRKEMVLVNMAYFTRKGVELYLLDMPQAISLPLPQDVARPLLKILERVAIP